MRSAFLLSLVLLGLNTILNAQIPAKKFDTTMKMGRVGYRVFINNKNAERNSLTITPVGFDKNVSEVSFEVKGRTNKAEVDDVNRDGFPDLVVYVFTNDSIPQGKVIGIASEKNEQIAPIGFPDILDDPKLRTGYKGFDTFMLLEGYLVRRFPVYSAEGVQTNMIRQIMYQVVPAERGGYKFKSLRMLDYNKQ